MTEQNPSPHEAQPYWNDEQTLGLLFFGRDHREVLARSHIAREQYQGQGSETLFPLSHHQGERVYIQSRFITPTIPGVTGEHRIGDAQAWFYPRDRVMVLWEVLLESRFARTDPREDYLLRSLWLRYEQLLSQRFPAARALVTTWEDTYDRHAWQGFLRTLGYAQTLPAAFRKHISGRV